MHNATLRVRASVRPWALLLEAPIPMLESRFEMAADDIMLHRASSLRVHVYRWNTVHKSVAWMLQMRSYMPTLFNDSFHQGMHTALQGPRRPSDVGKLVSASFCTMIYRTMT